MELTQYLAHGLVASGIYALIAVSFGLIYRATGIFHVAHGAAVVVGAYSTYALVKLIDLPAWVGIAGALLAGSAVGLLSYLLVYRPLRRDQASETVLTLASFGFYLIVSSFIATSAGTEPKVLRIDLDQRFEVQGIAITQIQLLQLVWSLALVGGFLLTLKFTRLGSLLRAMGNNSELLEVLGFRTNGWFCLVFVVGSALAAAAGQLLAFDRGLTPTMGFSIFLTGAVACLLGWQMFGHNSLAPVIAAVFLGILQALVIWKFGTLWRDTVVYIVLLMLLVLRGQRTLDLTAKGIQV